MVATEEKVNEDLRLQYRFLDLRRDQSAQNIMMRSKVIDYIRQHLSARRVQRDPNSNFDLQFPEGARDFLVPSRIHPGKFYALPQAPQQFKQLADGVGF